MNALKIALATHLGYIACTKVFQKIRIFIPSELRLSSFILSLGKHYEWYSSPIKA